MAVKDLLVVAVVAVFFAGAFAADSYTAIAARDGFYRQLTVAAVPDVANATSISVAAIGAQVAGSGGVGSARVDVAGFKFKNPTDLSDGENNRGLGFYFGYLGVSGTWNNDTKTQSLAGALAEIAAGWTTIFVYYDNDGVPGAQVNLTQDWLNCAAGFAGGFDCLDNNGSIPLNNLTWGPITGSKADCPAGYGANCSIWSLTTASLDGIISFTMHLASEPVLINNVRVEPNYAKIDVTINYPWAALSAGLIDATKANLGLVAFTAGRAGAAAAVRTKVDNKDAVVFEAADKSAYFSWEGTAVVPGSTGTVYAQGISGAQLKSNDCSKCGFTGIYVAVLQLISGWYEAFGWKTEMIVFSWNEVKPTQVAWDPALGLAPSPPPAPPPPTTAGPAPVKGSAAALIPSAVLLVVSALLF
jgi:hypothetical protein